MADSSREAGQQSCARTCPHLSWGCSETGRIAWGQTALILKPPQARGASSAWPIRGIVERCRAPGMAKNSLYRGLPSRCQNPGCISGYICKFVAKRPAGICLPATEQALLRQRTAGRRSRPVRGLPDESKYPGLPCFGVQLCIPRRRSRHSRLAAYAAFAQTLADRVRPLSRQWFRHPCPSTPRPTSPVTQADREVEAALRAAISQQYPEHGIFGEEYGVQQAEAEFVWSLDPIDGTRAFISGNPVGLAGVVVPRASRCWKRSMCRCWTSAGSVRRGRVESERTALFGQPLCKPGPEPFCMRLRPISSIPPNWPHSTPWRVRRACVAMAAIATAMACSPAAMSTWWSRRDCSL